MLFAHLKRILRLGRLRLRGPCGAKDEFLLAATAQKLEKTRSAEAAGHAGGGISAPQRRPCRHPPKLACPKS